MSDYRDDTQDTVIASDKTFIGLRAVAEEVLKAKDALLFGIAITLSSSAIASDEVVDTSIQVLNDIAIASSAVVDSRTGYSLCSDQAKISETVSYGLRELTNDSASAYDYAPVGSVTALTIDTAIASDNVTANRTALSMTTDTVTAKDSVTAIEHDLNSDSIGISDSISDKLKAVQMVEDSAGTNDGHTGTLTSVITDSAKISDNLLVQRIALSIIDDSVKATDTILSNYSDALLDSASITDLIAGKQRSSNIIMDSVIADDSVIDSIKQNTAIQDSAQTSNELIDSLNAAILIIDNVVIEDEAVSIGGAQGQAWTANVDSWAMSRYNPYNYNRLVVINGVLYGEADDGIYRLDEQVSAVTASVKTGKMDLGKGALTHPSTAYLEYELSGGASMTVSTTQKGVEQQYTYMLPNEVADELTNGRFIFGRGLRGRHFAFELIMIGTHGHINDLSIEHTPTSRRV
tara:strand:- start:20627 stop:22012 length:1386 start_codon:yes stop_codon:yes gene_type:complete